MRKPPPPVDHFTKLVSGTWTEIRAVVLKAIWDARCDLLHNNTTTRAEAIALALATVKSSLRVLAYQKLPSLLPGILKPRPQGDLAFYKLTWGSAPGLALLLPRHTPPPVPPAAAGGAPTNTPFYPSNTYCVSPVTTCSLLCLGSEGPFFFFFFEV